VGCFLAILPLAHPSFGNFYSIGKEMNTMTSKHARYLMILSLFAFVSLFAMRASAQATAEPRITQAVDETKLTMLPGNTHPLARAEFDRGVAPATLPMEHMLLVLARSPAQEAALKSFMAEQLDRSSPQFHHWLTPEEFGQLYGPAKQDMAVITKWLGTHGFRVNNVGVTGNTIDFSGTAAQVQTAFHTSIHRYVVNNKDHWANSSDPAIPTALAPVVAGIRSLHNFHPQPMSHVRRVSSARPAFTFSNGNQSCDIAGSSDLCFAVGANDFATIYSVSQLWNNGIDGTGETIAIVADSNIDLEDVAQFRALFGLPLNVPNVILTSTDPGLNGDETEAALDTEWTGAVAKNATIDLVVSPSTNTTFGGDTSALYIIEHSVAPILSESFGACELGIGTTGNTFYNQTWETAAAEDITVIVSAGDNGSAACDIDEVNGAITQPAENGLQVNGLASTPSNVAVGGTDFNDLGTQSLYWNQTPGTQASALSYIPENVWNDTCTNPIVFPLISANPPVTDAVTSCSNLTVQQAGLVVVAGASGGESNCTTSNGNTPSSCSGGNTQPAWQKTAGVPGTTRDVPDISLFAGDGFAGSFYVMCQMDVSVVDGGQGGQPCTLGAAPLFLGVGGTSVSTQVFAGIMALVNQLQGGPQGNASSVLYPLASSQPKAFNDITIGNNAMPCVPKSIDCSTNAAGTPAFRLGPGLRINAKALRIACALSIGLLLLLLLCFGGKQRRWVTPAALCGTAVLLAVSIGCGGSGSSSGGEGTPEGVLVGSNGSLAYNATAGYDLATGLGSVNAFNLANSTLWAAAPNPQPPATLRRPNVTAPIALFALACAVCLGLLFVGLGRRQMRWSTALLLVALALSILNAARSRAGTLGGHATTQHSATSQGVLSRPR
jgi:Pro-kumamolisin, activation domain